MHDFFQNIGITINGITHLSPKETYQMCMGEAILVDIREDFEIMAKQFDVKNIIYMPKSVFKENYHTLPKDKAIIITDSVGLRSKEAVIFLQQSGYGNIANLNGGIADWEKDKLPMLIDKKEMLTGSCLCQLRPKKKFNKEK